MADPTQKRALRINEEADHTSESLLTYLRDQLDDPTIGYESPPTRLQGGFATHIYRFQLKGARKELTEPLVLRLYPEHYDAEDAVWEGTVQDVLAAEGYPAAKVHLSNGDSVHSSMKIRICRTRRISWAGIRYRNMMARLWPMIGSANQHGRLQIFTGWVRTQNGTVPFHRRMHRMHSILVSGRMCRKVKIPIGAIPVS